MPLRRPVIRAIAAGLSAIPLSQLLKEWWASESASWARSNRIPRASLLDCWIVPYLGDVPLRELGPARLIVYRSKIVADQCTPKQANAAMRTLSSALGWAVRTDRLPENPCARVRNLSVSDAAPRPRAIGIDQIERLRAAMQTDRDRAMVSVLFYCGLRPGELLALRWGDVGERTLTIDRSFSAGELKGTKTGSRRSVALILAVRSELRALRPPSATDGDLVAPSGSGGFLDLNNWRPRVWHPAVIAANLDADPERGLAALTPYDGRHSFASALIHEGRSVIEVAAQLGHTSAQTTLKHYAHIVEEARGGDRMNLAEAVELAQSGTQDVRNLYAPRVRGHLRLVVSVPH